MNAFELNIHFSPAPNMEASALQAALQTALQEHLNLVGIPFLSMELSPLPDSKGSCCRLVTQVVEFSNGFPYRVMLLGGLNQVFDSLNSPILCIPGEGMKYIE